MANTVWQKAITASADPSRARHFYEQVAAGEGAFLKKASAELARVLASLFSGSVAMSEWLVAHTDLLATTLAVQSLEYPRQKQGLERELRKLVQPHTKTSDFAGALSQIREFKQREMLRIAARDLARLGNASEVTLDLSNVADICLAMAYEICRRQICERLGEPHHQDAEGRWHKTEFAVFGLGKLGGQELNYSSDVDLLFVYADEGQIFKQSPRSLASTGKNLPNFQFFKRLCEAFIAAVGHMTPEGMLYRIDMRLRPEGSAGPLARALSSYENYYAQWGQTWERMMLIKARLVAGNESLASEFLEMVQSFRYPRSISERILAEVTATKRRIETEVVRIGEIDRNVKLGHGGIREIEFTVQTLQLLHAGRLPFLQTAQTLTALQKLAQYKLLPDHDAEALNRGYIFLRDVEHRLQMENNLQTHTIPTERKARERLSSLMGFETLADFEKTLQQHTRNVRTIYERLLKVDEAQPHSPLPATFDQHEVDWKRLLASHSFRDVDKAFPRVREFVKGPGYIHISLRTEELARELFARFLEFCPRTSDRNLDPKRDNAGGPAGAIASPQRPVLSDPDRVLVRLDSFISAYGARATLYELWIANRSLFDLLLLLFDRSEFLAEIAIRTPDLVDDLQLSGRLRQRRDGEKILADLRLGRGEEDQRLWLRRYHQAELMRLGLRDILGLADFEQNLVELSALADACLQYALEVILRKHRFKSPPFAIIGLGKLGGRELNYGSDLDIIFVADNAAKNFPQLQKLAVEIMDLLSSPTELGVAFVTDPRLRPDGEKGLLVNTLAAHEDYYRHRAQLWEIQALTRTRPVAGNETVGAAFQRLAGQLTNFSQPSLPLAAFTPKWKEEIARMRLRIEMERTPPGKQAFAIKTGAGGLMDAEFIAQMAALEHGWQEPNTLRNLELAREARALPTDKADRLVQNCRKLRRIEGILRRWSFEGETLLPDDPAPLYRVAVRCGFPDADTFMQDISVCRSLIREAYHAALKNYDITLR